LLHRIRKIQAQAGNASRRRIAPVSLDDSRRPENAHEILADMQANAAIRNCSKVKFRKYCDIHSHYKKSCVALQHSGIALGTIAVHEPAS
jgi:hypothetical protein